MYPAVASIPQADIQVSTVPEITVGTPPVSAYELVIHLFSLHIPEHHEKR